MVLQLDRFLKPSKQSLNLGSPGDVSEPRGALRCPRGFRAPVDAYSSLAACCSLAWRGEPTYRKGLSMPDTAAGLQFRVFGSHGALPLANSG